MRKLLLSKFPTDCISKVNLKSKEQCIPFLNKGISKKDILHKVTRS